MRSIKRILASPRAATEEIEADERARAEIERMVREVGAAEVLEIIRHAFGRPPAADDGASWAYHDDFPDDHAR